MLANPFQQLREKGRSSIAPECPLYKISLLGDGAVGKTALRHRFMQGMFDDNYSMTIGADFATKTIEIDGNWIKFQIWDLAGQPHFSSIRPIYNRGSLGALVVFDISVPESFQNVLRWIEELWKSNGKGLVPIILLGNKLDLRGKLHGTVTFDQAKMLAERLSENTEREGFAVPYLETSAKTGANVQQAFTLLGQQISDFIAQRIGN
ncbi:MAG: GTP-binding protein [Candidatus Hodarchaeota archaeon]